MVVMLPFFFAVVVQESFVQVGLHFDSPPGLYVAVVLIVGWSDISNGSPNCLGFLFHPSSNVSFV